MQSDNYTPASVAAEVKKYDGVRRKQAIGSLVKTLHIDNLDVIEPASYPYLSTKKAPEYMPDYQ